MEGPPRELITSIQLLKFVPIADPDQCCGGGGTYSLMHPEISRDVLSKKIKNIMASKCQIVVMPSVSCLIPLAFGLREAGSNIEALHLSEFLWRALEKGK